jgi:hypothetical protein
VRVSIRRMKGDGTRGWSEQERLVVSTMPHATSVKESEQLEIELARYSGTGSLWARSGIAPLWENWKDPSTGEGARQEVVAEAMHPRITIWFWNRRVDFWKIVEN